MPLFHSYIITRSLTHAATAQGTSQGRGDTSNAHVVVSSNKKIPGNAHTFPGLRSIGDAIALLKVTAAVAEDCNNWPVQMRPAPG